MVRIRQGGPERRMAIVSLACAVAVAGGVYFAWRQYRRDSAQVGRQSYLGM